MCPLSLRPSPTSCSPSFLTTIHLVSPLILSVASSGLTLHLVLPFIPNDQSVKRTDRSSSALTTARPSSLTWSSWWSSTSSTKGCCLANWDTRAPLWPYDLFQRPDTSPTTAHNVIFPSCFVSVFSYTFFSSGEAGEWTDASVCCFSWYFLRRTLLETAELISGGFVGWSLRLDGQIKALNTSNQVQGRRTGTQGAFMDIMDQMNLPFYFILFKCCHIIVQSPINTINQ